jgi:uncharacterized membrane protein
MNDSIFLLSKNFVCFSQKVEEILLFLIKFSSLILSCVCMYMYKKMEPKKMNMGGNISHLISFFENFGRNN